MDIDKYQEDIARNSILVVFGTESGQKFLINRSKWDDPAAWGILLCDIAYEVASAYGANRLGTVNRIMEGFRAEFDSKHVEPSSE